MNRIVLLFHFHCVDVGVHHGWACRELCDKITVKMSNFDTETCLGFKVFFFFF